MAIITLTEYARIHNRAASVVRLKAMKGGFTTARKLGRDWVIDENEPYTDNRIKTGKYIGAARSDPAEPKRRGRPPKKEK